jgi:hypothetical protein
MPRKKEIPIAEAKQRKWVKKEALKDSKKSISITCCNESCIFPFYQNVKSLGFVMLKVRFLIFQRLFLSFSSVNYATA